MMKVFNQHKHINNYIIQIICQCLNLFSVSFLVPPNITLRLTVRGDTIKVKAGEPVNIPAEVTGLPMPKIEWTKDEVVIEKTTPTLKIEKQDISRSEAKTEVIMPSAQRSDKGTYTITASNRLGSVNRSVNVEVYGMHLVLFSIDIFTLFSKFKLLTVLFETDRPSPPRNLAVTDIKAQSCYLIWDAPVDNGGSEITNYIIDKRDASKKKSEWEEVSSIVVDRRYGVICL